MPGATAPSQVFQRLHRPHGSGWSHDAVAPRAAIDACARRGEACCSKPAAGSGAAPANSTNKKTAAAANSRHGLRSGPGKPRRTKRQARATQLAQRTEGRRVNYSRHCGLGRARPPPLRAARRLRGLDEPGAQRQPLRSHRLRAERRNPRQARPRTTAAAPLVGLVPLLLAPLLAG